MIKLINTKVRVEKNKVIDLIDRNPKDLLNTAKNIYLTVQYGITSYDTAKKITEPYLFVINLKAKEIAERHNQPFNEFTFSDLGRGF